MPPAAAAAIPTWALITGAVAPAAATVAGAAMSSHAANKSTKTQGDAAAAALAEQKRQDDLNREQYMAEWQRQIDLQNRQIAADNARRQAIGAVMTGGANGKLADLLGLPSPDTSAFAPIPLTSSNIPPMPTGWKPGDPLPPIGNGSPTDTKLRPVSTAGNPMTTVDPATGMPAALVAKTPAGIGAPGSAPTSTGTLADLVPTAALDPRAAALIPRPPRAAQAAPSGSLADLAYGYM